MKSNFGGFVWSRTLALTGAVLALGIGTARADTQYWDSASTAGLQGGTGIWNAVDAYYWATNATPSAGGPSLWTNGNVASFDVNSTVVAVDNVTAYRIRLNANPVTLFPVQGGGPLHLGAGGQAYGANVLYITCPIVLDADQMWSINNSTGQKVDGAISGPGRLTVRMGSAAIGTGGMTVTNVNNAFNGCRVVFKTGILCAIKTGILTWGGW